MSNGNSIGLQHLKPVHTPFKLTRFINVVCTIWPKLVLGTRCKWPRTRRDVCSRDRDVDNFSRDETETKRWYVSRPSWVRDHNPISLDQLNTADSSVLLHKFWCNTCVGQLPKITDQVVMTIMIDVFWGQDRQSPAVKANVSGPTPS